MPAVKAAIRLWICLLGGACAATFAACGGGASSEVASALRRGELDLALRLYEAQGAPHRDSLVAIAGAALEREADSGDAQRSAQAFAALRQVGTAARPALDRLAERSERTAVRARALALLAALGDRGARDQLRAQLDSADPEVAAAAVTVLDPESEAADLRARLESPAAAVRIAAVQRLARAPRDAETERALARSAQHDPELAVRTSALLALARQGPGGVRAIEARLSDGNTEVRAAAASMLAGADLARARERLAPLVAGDVTAEGIEAARALIAADGQRAGTAARGLLARAVVHGDPALRGRAAVALMSLIGTARDPQLQALAAERAAHEPVRSVRLCLALALDPAHPARAKLLRDLIAARDVTSVQAAAELALRDDAGALAALRALTVQPEPSVRRAAVRALGHELGRGHEIRAALRDRDAAVRIAAAAAILGAK
jgi:HEAT repeat protein